MADLSVDTLDIELWRAEKRPYDARLVGSCVLGLESLLLGQQRQLRATLARCR